MWVNRSWTKKCFSKIRYKEGKTCYKGRGFKKLS